MVNNRLDIEGTYPHAEIIANASRETTFRELSEIRGLSHEERKAVGVHLTAGTVNALEICTLVLKMPTTAQLLEAYRQKKTA